MNHVYGIADGAVEGFAHEQVGFVGGSLFA